MLLSCALLTLLSFTLTSASPNLPTPAPTGFALLPRRAPSPLQPLDRRQSIPAEVASFQSSAAADEAANPVVPSSAPSPAAAPLAVGNVTMVEPGAAGNGTVNAAAGGEGGGGQGGGGTDLVVLQLALTLENLESTFYSQALEKFSLEVMVETGLSEGQAAVVIEEITAIQADEGKHAKALTGAIVALGGTPFDGCKFDFSAAMKDPLTFLSTARTLEAVGQSAYLGAARLLSDPQLLTAAGSILTLEARHQSFLNIANGGSFNPQAFDMALQPEAVLGLAGGFLKDCQASDLGLKANNPLTITPSDGSFHFSIGTSLTFESIIPLDLSSLSCQMVIGGAPSAIVLPAYQCAVPSGIDGPVAVYLTKSSTPLATNIVIQNVGDIAAGPGLIFVDSKKTALAGLFKIQGGGGGGEGNVEVQADVLVDGGGSHSPSYRRFSRVRRRPLPLFPASSDNHDEYKRAKVLGWSRRSVVFDDEGEGEFEEEEEEE
ncbi:hypothetical protein JCM8547_000930 [Rhodosporidiobolus lusitaniae]